MNHYHVNIFWSDEDKAYMATVPDLQGCSAYGDTQEEALAEVNIAKQLWIEAAREMGDPIPEPRYTAPAATA
jgi:predicted RNase H-like HicB family nuclease